MQILSCGCVGIVLIWLPKIVSGLLASTAFSSALGKASAFLG